MESSRTMPDISLIHGPQPDAAFVRKALVEALTASTPSIPPRFFYDALGSALFRAICALPEYYLSRTEAAIFNLCREQIASVVGLARQLVDLGCGDCEKARGWMPWLRPSRYVAVDIDGVSLERSLRQLGRDFHQVEMLGYITDFSEDLALRPALAEQPSLFFYPGSSIGNFSPEQAVRFLAALRSHCRTDDCLLVGIDTCNQRTRLEAAYNDTLGITAAFNRNILNNVNRLLDADFDHRAFRHLAFYNQPAGRIEMHLEVLRPQQVNLGDRLLDLPAGCRIHTENSYKYTPERFAALLDAAGFVEPRLWQDAQGDFSVFLVWAR